MYGAGELLREGQRLALRLEVAVARHELHRDDPVGERRGGLDRVDQTLAHVGAHHQPVDDDRHIVLDLAIELEEIVEAVQFAVDQHAREALDAEVLEQLAVLPLAPAHDRREHHEARPLLQLEHLVGDLLQ